MRVCQVTLGALLIVSASGLRPKDAYNDEIQVHHVSGANVSSEVREPAAFDLSACAEKAKTMLSTLDYLDPVGTWKTFRDQIATLTSEARKGWAVLSTTHIYRDFSLPGRGHSAQLPKAIEAVEKVVVKLQSIETYAASDRGAPKAAEDARELIADWIRPGTKATEMDPSGERHVGNLIPTEGKLIYPLRDVAKVLQQLSNVAYKRDRMCRHFTWASNYAQNLPNGIKGTPQQMFQKVLDMINKFDPIKDWLALYELCTPDEDPWKAKPSDPNSAYWAMDFARQLFVDEVIMTIVEGPTDVEWADPER